MRGTTTDTLSTPNLAQLQEEITALQVQINQFVSAQQPSYLRGAPAVITFSGNTIPPALPSTLTASDIPTNIVAANYLPLVGGTLTGALLNSSTAPSSFLGALGIGTTSPSDVFAVNGPIYLADISPSATANHCKLNVAHFPTNGRDHKRGNFNIPICFHRIGIQGKLVL